jgi:hypothetical protein
MIINGKLRDFVCYAIAKGQITLGDVRRLQRGCLPDGITNREELEILISLNAKLVRADKAWAQWLVSVVADFVTGREACERPSEDAASKWVQGLLAASATNLGLRIARQIRRRLRAIHSTRVGVQQAAQVRAREHHADDCSLQNNPAAEPPRCEVDEKPACSKQLRHRVRREMIPRRTTFADAPHGWYLATYVRNFQRSDLANLQSSRVSLVLAPCL